MLDNSLQSIIADSFAISSGHVVSRSAAVPHDVIDRHLVPRFAGHGRERVPEGVETTSLAFQVEFLHQLAELQAD